METPESRIARVLGISEAENRVFIQQVRAVLGLSPCDAWIACCVEMLPVPSAPEAVARRIEEMGLIARPAAKSGVLPPDQPDPPAGESTRYRRPSRKAKTAKRSVKRTGTSGDSRAKSEASEVSPKAPAPRREPRKLRSGRKEPRRPRTGWRPWNDPRDAEADPFDPSRVPLGLLGTCPHGVPLTGVCRICNPEKFEMLGDVD